MKVKQNIDLVNAVIRITIGLTVVAWSTSKLVKRPWRDSYIIMTLLGAMKVAEGIVRFCPLTFLYEKYAQKGQDSSDANGSTTSRNPLEGLDEDSIFPYSQT